MTNLDLIVYALYDFQINYAKQAKRQKLIDYLKPVYFYCLKSNIEKLLRINNNINIIKSKSNIYLTGM